jgi:hypothetical protein
MGNSVVRGKEKITSIERLERNVCRALFGAGVVHDWLLGTYYKITVTGIQGD